MRSQKTLRITLVLEVSIPPEGGLFQALVPAFWKFQGLAARELFVAVLKALEARSQGDLEAACPGRFRHKGRIRRIWELPFGRVEMPLVKFWDPLAGKVVWPLKLAMDLPTHVRWLEETLVPGYRLAVIQSFRESRKAMKASSPQGRAPSHHTIHRRFQGFAQGRLDPRAPAPEKPGEPGDPSMFQMADGTKVRLQDRGSSLGHTDLRLVVGSRDPQGPLEVMEFSMGESWDQIAKNVRERFPVAPLVLGSDGEAEISKALAGPTTNHQRCLVHGRRNLRYALYQDGVKKPQQDPLVAAYERIPGLNLCQAEVNRLQAEDRKGLREILQESEAAFKRLTKRPPWAKFPHTREYVLGLIEDGMTYLRTLLDGGEPILVSTNRMEGLMDKIAMRIKKIGRRWSVTGATNMLAACLTYALHPDRYAQAEASARGRHKPEVAVLITSLQPVWVS